MKYKTQMICLAQQGYMAFIKEGYIIEIILLSWKFLRSESLKNIYYFNNSLSIATYGKMIPYFWDEAKRKVNWLDLKGWRKSRPPAFPLPLHCWGVVLHVFYPGCTQLTSLMGVRFIQRAWPLYVNYSAMRLMWLFIGHKSVINSEYGNDP